MTSKNPHVLLVAAAALVMFASSSVAQVGASSTHGTVSSQTSTSGAGRSSGLGAVPEDFVRMKLAPGFMLGLNVLDDPDFSNNFRIDEQGNIAVPILGTMHIAGETVSEARAQIRKKLLEGSILKDPQVELTVLEYTESDVTIIGEVASPGKHPLLSPNKLVNVLALAGGLTVAAGNQVLITRGTEDKDNQPLLVHYSKATDPKAVDDVIVYPGDTVQVKRAGIVYVLGAVNRPGGFVMQEEGTINVLQAISLAYGTSVVASNKTIYLLRRNPDGTVAYVALPYKKMIHGQSANVQLHATDIVYVPTSMFKLIYGSFQGVIDSAVTTSIYYAEFR